MSADVSGITDSTDNVASAHFDYQWIRVDGTDETDIDGETGSTYTPTGDDVEKHLKVRVVFDDDAGYLEYPRTSPQFGPVVDAVPPTVGEGGCHRRHHHKYSFHRSSRPGFHPGRVGVRGPGGGYCQHGGLGRDRRY